MSNVSRYTSKQPQQPNTNPPSSYTSPSLNSSLPIIHEKSLLLSNYLRSLNYYATPDNLILREKCLGKLSYISSLFYNSRLYSFGSYRLGVHVNDSDIDCLMVGYKGHKEFFSEFYDILNMYTEDEKIVENEKNSDLSLNLNKNENINLEKVNILNLNENNETDVKRFKIDNLNNNIDSKSTPKYKKISGVIVKDLHKIEDAFVPLLKFSLNTISIDLLYAQLQVPPSLFNPVIINTNSSFNLNLLDDTLLKNMDDKSILSINGSRVTDILINTVPDKKVFHEVLKAVKYYAKNRGIYGHTYGYCGGVAYAIMVAKICQLHSLTKNKNNEINSKIKNKNKEVNCDKNLNEINKILSSNSNSNSKIKIDKKLEIKNEDKNTNDIDTTDLSNESIHILYKFFDTYANWSWPDPVIVKKVVDRNYNGLKMWDPKTYIGDRYHKMPIITPAYPAMCSTHNVGTTTLGCMIEEFKRGAEILKEDCENSDQLFGEEEVLESENCIEKRKLCQVNENEEEKTMDNLNDVDKMNQGEDNFKVGFNRTENIGKDEINPEKNLDEKIKADEISEKMGINDISNTNNIITNNKDKCINTPQKYNKFNESFLKTLKKLFSQSTFFINYDYFITVIIKKYDEKWVGFVESKIRTLCSKIESQSMIKAIPFPKMFKMEIKIDKNELTKKEKLSNNNKSKNSEDGNEIRFFIGLVYKDRTKINLNKQVSEFKEFIMEWVHRNKESEMDVVVEKKKAVGKFLKKYYENNR